MSEREAIQEIVNRETRGWDTQDVDLLITVFHPDMVWPFPPDSDAHDPITWEFVMGRFNKTPARFLFNFASMS